MRTTTTTVTGAKAAATALLLLLLLASAAEALPGFMCAFRMRNLARDPSKCRYGVETDNCGYQRCLKGPGDICGGKGNRYGACGEGLLCSNCMVCTGCSWKTWECEDSHNCI